MWILLHQLQSNWRGKQCLLFSVGTPGFKRVESICTHNEFWHKNSHCWPIANSLDSATFEGIESYAVLHHLLLFTLLCQTKTHSQKESWLVESYETRVSVENQIVCLHSKSVFPCVMCISTVIVCWGLNVSKTWVTYSSNTVLHLNASSGTPELQLLCDHAAFSVDMVLGAWVFYTIITRL